MRSVMVLAVLLLGSAACGGGGGSGMETRPLLEHLSNVVAVSGLDEAAIARLDASLAGAMEAGDADLAPLLDDVRATTLDALNALAGPDSLDATAEARMRSLLDVMNLSHAIAGAAGVELAVSQTVYKGYRCDRVGNGGQCSVRDSRYNCSHIGGSCFYTKSP